MKWVQAVLNYMYIYICMYLQNTPGASFIELRKHNISTKTKLVNKTRPPAKPSYDGLFLPVSTAGVWLATNPSKLRIACSDKLQGLKFLPFWA